MAVRSDTATSDRQSRLLLAAVIVVAVVGFVWLVAMLAASALA